MAKFWLMRMPGIEIVLNFVPNPRKISKKKSFLSKPLAYLASWQLKKPD